MILRCVFKAFSEFWDGLSPQTKSILLVLLGLQITTGIPGAILTGLVNLGIQLAIVTLGAKAFAAALTGGGAVGGAGGLLGLIGAIYRAAAGIGTFVIRLGRLSPVLLGVNTQVNLFYLLMKALEEVANSFGGVNESYAIQAGREIRIIVKPEEIDDYAATNLSKDIARKVEESLQYPGQIKVTVIRETRAVDYAK